jgi:hypothetical protein
MVMLSHVAEQVRFADGRRFEIGGRERSGMSRMRTVPDT